MNNILEFVQKVEQNVALAVIGKEDVVRTLMVALITGGHVLLEDVPGIGKTTLVNTLAKSLDLSFSRMQFTPDVMPSDITGYNIFNQAKGEFEYKQGGIITNIFLADEINRTSPKTQAALLEAMQERQVTVESMTYKLPEPFMVLATENPVEQQGTYVLPEAQLDRFMFSLNLGYPTQNEEVEILSRYQSQNPQDNIVAVAGAREIAQLKMAVQKVYVADSIKHYLVTVIQETRKHPNVELGASPRASLMLLFAAKGNAVLSNRDYVIPDDIKNMAHKVLCHRLILKSAAELRKITPQTVVDEILGMVPVPQSR